VPCAAACQAKVAHSPKSAVSRLSFLILAVADLARASRFLYFRLWRFFNMEGNVGEQSMSSRNAAASLQSTVALTFRQGIAFDRIALGSKTLSIQFDTQTRRLERAPLPTFPTFIWLQRLPP